MLKHFVILSDGPDVDPRPLRRHRRDKGAARAALESGGVKPLLASRTYSATFLASALVTNGLVS